MTEFFKAGYKNEDKLGNIIYRACCEEWTHAGNSLFSWRLFHM